MTQQDELYDSYDRNLYKVAETNAVMASLNSDPSANNSANVETSVSDLASGVDTSTSQQATGNLQSGKSTFSNTKAGYILGFDPKAGLSKFYIGNTTNYLNWTGTSLVVAGSLSASSIDIPDTTTANSFHVDSSGNTWWGATTLGASVASVTKAGLATFTNVVATGTVNATGGYIGSTTALMFESQGINTGTTGYIRGGQTDYNTGTGFFLGYSGGTYKFSIGDAANNAVTWDGSTLTVAGNLVAGNPLYGSGADGDLSVTSGTTTLSGDKYYRHVSVSAGATLVTNGYVLYASVSITNAGTIKHDGGTGGLGHDGTSGVAPADGAGGIAGVGAPSGTLAGGTNGSAGGHGNDGSAHNGVNGIALNPSLVAVNGNTGGDGGDIGTGSPNGNGGAGGAATSETLNFLADIAAKSGISSGVVTSIATVLRTSGSTSNITHSTAPSGGGGGGGGRTAANVGGGGGGSAGGGGVVVLASPSIVNTGTISANGGTGGKGGDVDPSRGGGGGGGCGGAGGIVILIYSSLTAGTIQVNGGTGGAPGTGSSTVVALAGSTGQTGKIYKLNVGNNFVV